MRADGAPVGDAVRVDRADIVAVINVHALVRAEDTARGAGVDGGNVTGIVAVPDAALAPRAADDAADSFGVRRADGGTVRAVFHDHAVRRLADAPDDAADHAAAEDRAGGEHEIAHGGLPAVFKIGGDVRVVVARAAKEADHAHRHAVGKALLGVAVAVEIRDRMPLPVQHAVEARVKRHAVAGGLLGLHREFAADRRPVGARPRIGIRIVHAAHVKVGGEVNGLSRKVDVARVDGVEHVAAARAHEHHIVDADAL